jgi:hypothetical protein
MKRGVVGVLVGGALICSACQGPLARTHRLNGALENKTTAAFIVSTGVTALQIRSAAIPGQLYVVDTPTSARIVPVVTSDHAGYDLGFVGDGHAGPSSATLDLNDSVRWSLHLKGGSSAVSIDLAAGGFGSIDLAGGVAAATITLPRPSGNPRLSEEGGASSFHVFLPPATRASVHFAGGAGSASLDGSDHVGVPGGRTFKVSGSHHGRDRIDIELSGGIGRFVLSDAQADSRRVTARLRWSHRRRLPI